MLTPGLSIRSSSYVSVECSARGGSDRRKLSIRAVVCSGASITEMCAVPSTSNRPCGKAAAALHRRGARGRPGQRPGRGRQSLREGLRRPASGLHPARDGSPGRQGVRRVPVVAEAGTDQDQAEEAQVARSGLRRAEPAGPRSVPGGGMAAPQGGSRRSRRPANGVAQTLIGAARRRSGASRFPRSRGARRVVPVIQNEREYAMKVDPRKTPQVLRRPRIAGAPR